MEAKIYVPIDYSELRTIIPLGEDIIYSTLCKATDVRSEGTRTITTTWKSHMLMTSKGVGYTVIQRGGPPALCYKPWYLVPNIKKNKIFVYKRDFRASREFEIINTSYESAETFFQRSSEFLTFLTQIRHDAICQWFEEIIQWAELSQNPVALKKLKPLKIRYETYLKSYQLFPYKKAGQKMNVIKSALSINKWQKKIVEQSEKKAKKLEAKEEKKKRKLEKKG